MKFMELFEVELEFKSVKSNGIFDRRVWKDWEEECRSHATTIPAPKSLKTKVVVSPS